MHYLSVETNDIILIVNLYFRGGIIICIDSLAHYLVQVQYYFLVFFIEFVRGFRAVVLVPTDDSFFSKTRMSLNPDRLNFLYGMIHMRSIKSEKECGGSRFQSSRGPRQWQRRFKRAAEMVW